MSRYNINLYSFVPPFSCLLDRKGFSFLFFKGFFLGGGCFCFSIFVDLLTLQEKD